VRLTSNSDHAVLLATDFAGNSAGWSSSSNWEAQEGVYRQTNELGETVSFAGDTKWSDYTLSLKARKLAGEGSLVITVCDDGKGAHAQWILGGWDNKQHGIMTHYAEQDQLLDRVPGTIETNRWYTIQISVKGDKMECSLDGTPVQSAEILHLRVPTLFTSAAKDESTGQTILKVVNPQDEPAEVTIQLQGAAHVLPTGTEIVLKGAPADENSFDKPTNVAPVSTSTTGISSEFAHTFPAHSFTVLRLGTLP
jgi:alpha-L-arabinofuranosidase